MNKKQNRKLIVAAFLAVMTWSLFPLRSTLTIKSVEATGDPPAGFCGVYRNFGTNYYFDTGNPGGHVTGLVKPYVPWIPTWPLAPPWPASSPTPGDWYATPACLVRIDPVVSVNKFGVTGLGLQFTPADFLAIPELYGGLPNDPGLFTVEWEATITVLPSPIYSTLTFSMNSDDDSWFFFDGTLIPSMDLGGSHDHLTNAGTWTTSPTTGVHSITIYYAERKGWPDGEFYFGITSTPSGAFVYNDPSELCAKKSFEDLLKHQAERIQSFEDLLRMLPRQNRTFELFVSFENLTKKQEDLLKSFEDLIKNQTRSLQPAEYVILLDSFEDLLHKQCDIKESFIDLFNDSREYLRPHFFEILFSIEDLIRSDDELLKSFEGLVHNLYNMTGVAVDQKIYFLESFEDLLMYQSQLLFKFEELIKWNYRVSVVTEKTSSPVVGAGISLYGEDANVIWSGVTDDNGQASFDITFTQSNYTDTLRLEAVKGKFYAAENITFFSETSTFLKMRNSADLNGDGKVDVLDILLCASAFGSSPEQERWNPVADVDGNSEVGITDIVMVARQFGSTV